MTLNASGGDIDVPAQVCTNSYQLEHAHAHTRALYGMAHTKGGATAHAHPQPFCMRVPFSVSVFTAAVWCAPAVRVPLVHSLINHFRQKCKIKRELGLAYSTCEVRACEPRKYA